MRKLSFEEQKEAIQILREAREQLIFLEQELEDVGIDPYCFDKEVFPNDLTVAEEIDDFLTKIFNDGKTTSDNPK
jgi:hypothetical protein